MFAYVMYLISTNPTGGPVWFGALCDIFTICVLVYFIYEAIKNGRNK